MRHLLLVTLLFLLFAVGCGPAAPTLAPVSGKVTLNGQPLSKGNVNFENTEKGFAAFALLQPDGAYTVRCQFGEGLPLGKYKVTMTPPQADQPKPGTTVKVEPTSIPEKYRNPSTSGLVADVQRGAAPFNFDLKE